MLLYLLVVAAWTGSTSVCKIVLRSLVLSFDHCVQYCDGVLKHVRVKSMMATPNSEGDVQADAHSIPTGNLS